MKHVEAVIELLNAITNSDRFSVIGTVINEKEKGTEQMFTELFDEAEARGIATGRIEGLAAGRIEGIAAGIAKGEIIGTIKLYHDEMNLSPSEITDKIMVRFSLDREEAERYTDEVLGLQLV